MDDLEIIDRYLRAQLDSNEEHLFIQRVRSDPKFKKEVLIHTLMVKAILNVGRQKDRTIRQSVKCRKMSWNKYMLIYSVYSNYYFTGNMPRYNRIFSNSNRTFLAQ